MGDGATNTNPATCDAVVHPNGYPPPGPIGNTEGLICPATAPNIGGDSAPPIQPEPEEKSWWQRWGSAVTHGVLDVVGLIPVVGEIADGANALIYTAEGDYANAALSAAAMVPIAGWAATGAKGVKRAATAAEGAMKLGRQGVEEGAGRIAREVPASATGTGTKKAENAAGGHVGKRSAHEGAAFGEATAHDKMVRNGYEPVGKTDGQYKPGAKGIDGVYRNPSPPPDYVVTEVKYNTSQLSKGLADGTNQMDDRWLGSRLADKVGEVEAELIHEAMDAGTVEKWLIRVKPDGSTSTSLIDGLGNVVRGKAGKPPGN